MEKKLTPSQAEELERALPQRFKELDAEFHLRAQRLGAAAAAHDAELVVYHYSRLIESCTTCHAAYAGTRFPGFARRRRRGIEWRRLCAARQAPGALAGAKPGVDWRFQFRTGRAAMPKFVIEREIPGAGKLSPQELHAISQKSCGVLSQMGPQIPVGAELRDRRQGVLRVHRAGRKDGAEARGAGRVSRQSECRGVMAVIDPTTAE